MEKICQTCGVNGFSRALIYCTECWDTVEHIYCLGLSADDIIEGFSWLCDSCRSIDVQLAKMIIYGDKSSGMPENAVSGPLRISDLALCAASAVPVVGPIWRGAVDTLGSYYGSLEGLEVFMPKTSYPKVLKVVRSMPPSLYFNMKRRHELWPKNFDESGAAECKIGLYIFPEFSRSETDYNNLVECMISNDLAMTTNIANLELILFTSLQISASEKQKIQGKCYLWGMVREKDPRENPSRRSKSNAVCFPEKPSVHSRTSSLIQSGAKTKQWIKHKNTIKKPFHQSCSGIPLLRPECRRARSKRGKKRNDRPRNKKQAIVLHSTFDKPSQAEKCTIAEAIHQEEGQARVAREMKTPNTETVNEFSVIISGEQNNASLLKDIIDYSENNAKGKDSEKEDRSYGQDLEEQPVSPLRASAKEKSVDHEAMDLCEFYHILDRGASIEEIISSISDKLVGQIFNECIQKLETEQPKWENGLTQLPTLEHQLEAHIEKSSCITPVLDLGERKSEASACPSTTTTHEIVELDAEETTIDGCHWSTKSKNHRETSIMTIPVSILDMAGDYHEASSKCVSTQVGRYHIKSDLAPILKKILEKYGDFALNCSIEPDVPLENICQVVQDLESVHLSSLRHYHVTRLKKVLQLADALGINVKWLCERCKELENLASHLSQYPTLKSQVAQSKKDIECMEETLILKRVEVAKLQAEIKLVEENLESMKKYAEKLDCDMVSIKTMCENFHGKSVVDGLL